MEKRYGYIFTGILVLFMALAFSTYPVEAANKKATISQKTGYTIDQDTLRKRMSKKLGTPYSKMDCSAYAAWVLQNLGEKKAQEGAIKDIKIVSGRSTYVWERSGALKISYKPAVYNTTQQKWVWGKRKKVSVNKSITKWKTCNKKAYRKAEKQLKVGDALLYKNDAHIAYYFGEFDSVNEVVSYLKNECGMKKLKKSKTPGGNICYKYKGKTVLVYYADCGTKWRIHSSTSNGVVIDNDLTYHDGKYAGKWCATVRFIETTDK